MQNRTEHKKVWGMRPGKPAQLQWGAWLPYSGGGEAAPLRRRPGSYFPASSAGTSFRETELMQ
ncbi:hypothetical protein QFZ79_004030 [Arthrobacter sp. V4I6]|nr:hypothetical protein [Arthrobacter sp. V1I7]MDQ0855919.1 hypothetical protein [Arthrobacter sp. V4I6]